MRPVPVPELELLLLCARMQIDEDAAQRISGLLSRGLDWNRLVSVAHRHGLALLLHRTLSGPPSKQVPAQILERLQSQHEAFHIRNLFFVRELAAALRALEAAGITATPYKGPALAAYLYGDLTLRQFGDIDLLVRPCDAIAARRALIDRGFIPERQISDWARAAWVRFHCEFTFTSFERHVLVELKWRDVPWYWRLPEIPDSAWNRLGRLSLAGMSVPWFAPEDILSVLCLHGCRHKWDQLKWVVDVAELLRTHPKHDWREALDEARRTGSERMLALGMFLAHDLLDAPLLANVLAAVQRKPMVAILAAEVCDYLFTADAKRVDFMAQLAFVSRATERLETKIFCHLLRPLYFLLHRIVWAGITAIRQVTKIPA